MASARNTWQSQETRAAGKTRLSQAEVVREVVSQKLNECAQWCVCVCVCVERERERDVIILWTRDCGNFMFWCPKLSLSFQIQFLSSSVRNTAIQLERHCFIRFMNG